MPLLTRSLVFSQAAPTFNVPRTRPLPTLAQTLEDIRSLHLW